MSEPACKPCGEEASPTHLALPSIDEARRMLRELEWDERFVGIEMNPAAGNRDVYLYSMKEAVQFLRYGTAGMGLSIGATGSISWFEVDRFARWLGEDVGDADLAGAICSAARQASTFHDQVDAINCLLSNRFQQLSELVSGEPED